MIQLKKARESVGMTAEELGRKTNLSRQTIWAYERGNRSPDPETLCVLSDALGVSIDEIVRGKEKDRSVERSMSDLVSRLESYSLQELREIQAFANYLMYRKEREQEQGQASADN